MLIGRSVSGEKAGGDKRLQDAGVEVIKPLRSVAVSGSWLDEFWRWSRVRNVLRVALGSMSVTVLRVCVQRVVFRHRWCLFLRLHHE